MCAAVKATLLRGHSSCVILDCVVSADALSRMISNRSPADDDWSRSADSVGSMVCNCWDYDRSLCMKDQCVMENVSQYRFRIKAPEYAENFAFFRIG